VPARDRRIHRAVVVISIFEGPTMRVAIARRLLPRGVSSARFTSSALLHSRARLVVLLASSICVGLLVLRDRQVNVLSPQPRARLDVAIIVLEPVRVGLLVEPHDGRLEAPPLVRPLAPHFAPDRLRAQKRHVRADVPLARGEDDLDLRARIVRANAADGR
jgi:hypothetical protein